MQHIQGQHRIFYSFLGGRSPPKKRILAVARREKVIPDFDIPHRNEYVRIVVVRIRVHNLLRIRRLHSGCCAYNAWLLHLYLM